MYEITVGNSYQNKSTANLDTYANRTMAKVGPPCFWHRVVVDVNDLVEVPCGNLCNLVEPLKVKCAIWVHKHVQSNGGKIADSDLKRHKGSS